MIKITSMTARRLKPTKAGSIGHAVFSFVTDDFGLNGCILARAINGEWKVWAPTIDVDAARKQREQTERVFFRRSGTLYPAVVNAAVDAYTALFGDPEGVVDANR